ncbi:primosomal protein N' [Candidatus Methylacidiphilum infernorum]|uniref:Replication restart protein PriA n=1 Tax=Candidatus Methylacidiphilum infernorum TaxID=511746 RepID=A0ABX7PTR0_9BACT|nr:primosomal protein N' [Candidatus Methylacidiphilum infernorum]QSR86004.1 primosomal protein N' [Candidatus Methylacidiphilum infernorum]
MEQGFFFPPPSSPDLHVARVLLDNKRDFLLDYCIPEELEKEIVLGSYVRVPLKKGFSRGIVVDILEKQNSERLKPILRLENQQLTVPPNILKLCRWIANYYCTPLLSALQAALPQSVRSAVKPKQDLLLSLAPNIDLLLFQNKHKRAKKEKEALAYLQKFHPVRLSELPQKTGIPRRTWNKLLEKGLLRAVLTEKKKASFPPIFPSYTPPQNLTEEQRKALDFIGQQLENPKPKPILLFGVTGSGKTEVYLHAMARCLAQKKQVLFLVPEIALTPQLLERIHARFASSYTLGCWHSRISRGEKAHLWNQVLANQIDILIGTRSAIFAPFRSLGLIIVDEEHESSFKQEESPRYHGRDVAVMRGRLEGSLVLLGSATPSLESYYNALNAKYDLIELKKRVEERKLPLVSIIDLRKQKQRASRTETQKPLSNRDELISRELKEAIEKRLDKKEQVILYINHRGYSSSLQCSSCGYVLPCPNCSISLSYHKIPGVLNCHLCNYSTSFPSFCPVCKAGKFKFLGSGTEKVEESIRKLFPSARILRMDSDTMRKKGDLEQALRAFSQHDYDILVGTQMVAKGLDFPRVSLVGIVSIDSLLHLPDFRASEKSFQQLLQVSGRSGRGSIEGEVYIQTRTPYHPAIQFARHHDYLGFAEQELEFRKSLSYPPFYRAIMIRFVGNPEEKVKYLAQVLTREIKEKIEDNTTLVGTPSPAPIVKIKSQYHYQLFIRTLKVLEVSQKLRELLLDSKETLGITLRIDIDPQDLLK